MNDILVVCLVLFLMLLYNCRQSIESFMTLTSNCNSVDGRCYKVSNKFDKNTHDEASRILAKLNAFSIKLIRHLRETYSWDANSNPYRRYIVEYLLHNYNPSSIIENAPDSDVNTSYVEDKGKVFALCLREKESGKNNFLPMHMLEFVVIHEMAHMASRKIGHGHEFWVNFKILLQEADKIGLHTPVNYKIHPIKYCSLDVAYNPFFDKLIPGQI